MTEQGREGEALAQASLRAEEEGAGADMPYNIRKVNGGFAVYNKDKGTRKNKKPMSRAKAKAYLRALYANVPDAKKK